MGKGAKNGAWNLNYRIPFQKNVRVTAQATDAMGVSGGFYFIVRGAPDIPVRVGQLDVPVSKGAKLKLAVTQTTLQPLQWLPILSLTSGQGLIFMHSLGIYISPFLNVSSEMMLLSCPKRKSELPRRLLSLLLALHASFPRRSSLLRYRGLF
jgi:hypothetical protein